jgi:hypothetical protein
MSSDAVWISDRARHFSREMVGDYVSTVEKLPGVLILFRDLFSHTSLGTSADQV